MQSLHKAHPSTTLYYNACTKYFPVLLRTPKPAQILTNTTSYYKACKQHFPVLLRTTTLAQSTFQYYFVLQRLHKVLPRIFRGWSPRFYRYKMKINKIFLFYMYRGICIYMIWKIYRDHQVYLCVQHKIGGKHCENETNLLPNHHSQLSCKFMQPLLPVVPHKAVAEVSE